ncbi:MAG: TIGR01212 family radical SAM protein [Chromatiales bacterium]|nr:TIGR01212 family radical SAM protein [Chromatiales bacterium]
MALTDYINTMGRHLRARHGERVHKLCVSAGFVCPNMDGSKGRGGCTFCNNASFAPQGQDGGEVARQLAAGRAVIAKRTGARRYLAYFQAYTNTHAELSRLRALYDEALAQPGVVGLSIGTRPDCVPEPVLDLLADYRDRGHDVWLELGLQSAFDETLARVNRCHDFAEYHDAVTRARRRGLSVCTHLIAGLPGETDWHARETLTRVLDLGTDGLKLHPLHVVRGTQLAKDWQRGGYRPWTMQEYVATAADLIAMTPPAVVYHRLTATAREPLLLAPAWCAGKWQVLNAIERELARRGARQGSRLSQVNKVAVFG